MTSAGSSTLGERWNDSIANTYGTPGIVLVRGDGVHVWDETGQQYLDFLAGIAVNALGHAHPAIIDAVARQMSRLGHVSNLAITEPVVELAERLLEIAGMRGRVFFSNSGAEANEAAIKLTRLTHRHHLVAAEGGFHGRTMGALSITGQPAKRQPFQPLVPDVTFIPYGKEAWPDVPEPAALFLEPIQGENGVIVPPPGYLSAAHTWAQKHGALFVLDEVQTGIGRTGQWFGYQSSPDAHKDPELRPSVMTCAKGLGGGLPIGATLASEEVCDHWQPGTHGSTFGGNPISAAAALAVLTTIEQDGLLDHVRQMGDYLQSCLRRIPGVRSVRGRGLLIGVEVEAPAGSVVVAAQKRGLICNAIGSDVIRLAPPLIVTRSDIDTAVSILTDALAAEESTS